MAYVLRPHKGNNNLDGWGESSKYDENAIAAIEDPNGGAANIPITSIPSPFASMELVKRAFDYCTKNGLDGYTIYHKMVSFALDILEIMFNYDKHSNIINIVSWYKSDINELINSEDEDMIRLGNTLNLYLYEDAESFNFDKMNAIHMLNYKDGPDPVNIIGGTSPTSLTIASVNDMDYTEIYLGNNHRALNSDPDTFCSLHWRDPEFIKFVYAMSLQPSFPTIYPEVNKYIQKCFAAINDRNFKEELRRLTRESYDNYPTFTIDAQTSVYLAGDIAMKVRQNTDLSKSDFLINVSNGKQAPAILPLVLPYNTYTEPNMRYVSGAWDSNNKAPMFCLEPQDQRTLPFDGTPYPYLTVDDIFQPYIIETIYPISEKSFFTAGYKDQDNKSYLLPLKTDILQYMSLKDLMGVTREPSPRPIFEIKKSPTAIKAIIRIPIQKGKYITFERNYFKGMDPQPEQNKGAIIECKFNLFLYPSFHINKESAMQRIYFIDQDTGALARNWKYNVSAFVEGALKPLSDKYIPRADKSKYYYTTFYKVLDKEYDFLMVTNDRATNMLIPLFEDRRGGTSEFEFAVDFGTTNTHIEYREAGSNAARPLEIELGKPHILKLSNFSYSSKEDYSILLENNAEFLLQTIPQEFIPETLGRNEEFSFPMRTNLSKLKDAMTGQRDLLPLADFSIAFGYEKKAIHRHNDIITDIKWNREKNEAVKAYIEELLMLIRSTIVINGGDLDKTTIKWFYPVSMSQFLKSRLVNSWKKACEEIISPNCKIQHISESIAPYYYYKRFQGVNSATCPVVSIDVGGGTSDFVAYQNNKAEFISSVRFAGNNIFGDFYGMGPQLNGFFKIYKDKFQQKINNSSEKANLNIILEDILSNNCTADMISFFFSLENNVALKQNGEKISLSDDLQENYHLKVVFLIFYTAIIYYVAKLLNKKGIPAPGYITCSGTASKIFNIIADDDILQKFSQLIFSELQGENRKLTLKQVKNPKEITCQGGLEMTNDDIEATPSKQFYFGSPILDDKDFITASEVGELSDSVLKELVENYNEFINFFFNLSEKMSFAEFFGIEDNGSFEKYKEVLTDYAEQDCKTVLDERLKDFQDNDNFEDSIFFYPISGGIARLAKYISES